MNTSVPLLLCLLLSTTHGEKEKDALHTSLPLKEPSCPDPMDILPCVCDVVDVILNCSGVEDEAQLRQVFTAHFPTTAFNGFFMDGNKGVRVLEDGVFGNVSFREIEIGFSALETVMDGALTPSLHALIEISFYLTPIAVFPFHILQEFTSLRNLGCLGCKMNSLPPLSSASLKELQISSSNISHLSQNVFNNLTAVHTIFLWEMPLMTEIAQGTFASIPRLSSLSLSDTMISSLPRLTFALTGAQGVPGFLSLDNNNIDSVEVDAFKGVQAPSNIELGYNALTTLQEAVWRPVLARGITVGLVENPLSCGCDIAWLVRDPTLLTGIYMARCADGTLLTDLDPADFDICG